MEAMQEEGCAFRQGGYGQTIKFIGVGEKLDALEPFFPDRLASRILGMGTCFPSSRKPRRSSTKKRP